ncbi:MAG: transglycosylase SLT domain-containing protein [Candidatus Schekmanbacteria bacterium]|nr:transglycosylase SLT domain-containing protein [Candidatus Schekmanbacteria bacterium]
MRRGVELACLLVAVFALVSLGRAPIASGEVEAALATPESQSARAETLLGHLAVLSAVHAEGNALTVPDVENRLAPLLTAPLVSQHARWELAGRYRDAGDPARAAAAYAAIVEAASGTTPAVMGPGDARLAEAYFAAIDAWLAAGELARADAALAAMPVRLHSAAAGQRLALRRAEVLRLRGDARGATRAYAAILAAESQDGVAAAALARLDELDAANPRTASDLGPEEVYGWAAARHRSGNQAGARTLLHHVIAGPHKRWRDQAMYLLGRTHQRDESWLEAAAAFRRAAAAAGRSGVAPQSLLQAGRCLVIAGKLNEARDAYRQLYRAFPRSDHAPAALFDIGSIYERRNNTKSAVQAYASLIRRYPRARQVGASRWEIGKLRLRSGDPGGAVAALEKVEGSPGGDRFAEEADFFLAAAYEQAGDLAAAIEANRVFLERHPNSYYADAARSALQRLTADPTAPAATTAREAAGTRVQWAREGLAPSGTSAETLDALRTALAAYPLAEIAGASERELGDAIRRRMAADALWAEVLSAGSAAEVAGVGASRERLTALALAWVSATDSGAATPLHRGRLLLAAGLAEEAASEFAASRATAAPERLDALAGLLAAARATGNLRRSIQAAERLRELLGSRFSPRLELPVALLPDWLLRELYPLGYAEEIIGAAVARELPPELVLALVHQESRFDPTAQSPAAARGLFQIIPATAAAVASDLGAAAPPGTSDLFQPPVAARLGTAYLASLVKRFNGSPERALAGYNGGPDNAASWLDRCACPERAVEYVASIPFSETRTYVKLVMLRSRLYAWLYGETLAAFRPGKPAPTPAGDAGSENVSPTPTAGARTDPGS